MGLGFNLVSKTTGIKFTEYKGNAIRLSKFAPYSVDEVVLKNGKKREKNNDVQRLKWQYDRESL